MRWPFRKQPTQPQAHEPDALPLTEASGTRSIAIDTGGGDFLGTALTGDNATAIQLPPEALVPPAGVQAPPGLDNLPARPNLFVGRSRELERLDAALASAGQAVVQAVHGLGGIGKSTLAAYWAATRPHGHNPVRWINADTPATVQQGLADLATALARALTAEALAERAAQWLATHTGWLIILDNVNDPADIAGLLARARGGHRPHPRPGPRPPRHPHHPQQPRFGVGEAGSGRTEALVTGISQATHGLPAGRLATSRDRQRRCQRIKDGAVPTKARPVRLLVSAYIRTRTARYSRVPSLQALGEARVPEPPVPSGCGLEPLCTFARTG